MIMLSGVFGMFAGGSGAVVSAMDVNLPTGPLMIVAACAVVFVSVLFAPQRGVIWTMLTQRRERVEVAQMVKSAKRPATLGGGQPTLMKRPAKH
jgi:manganese/zinc/iron transport system permease protein